MDTFMVRLADCMDVQETSILPHYDSRGNVMGLPQSYRERSWQSSDHNPIRMIFSLCR